MESEDCYVEPAHVSVGNEDEDVDASSSGSDRDIELKIDDQSQSEDGHDDVSMIEDETASIMKDLKLHGTRMEPALFSPPLSKQRVEYALKHINESCAATLVLHSKLRAVHDQDSPIANIKSALLYDGSITTFDTWLYGFDIGTCLEAEKKLAIPVFRFPTDKGNVGTAAYVNVFSSIYSVLKDLHENGYSVEGLPETAEALIEEVVHEKEAQFTTTS